MFCLKHNNPGLKTVKIYFYPQMMDQIREGSLGDKEPDLDLFSEEKDSNTANSIKSHEELTNKKVSFYYYFEYYVFYSFCIN